MLLFAVLVIFRCLLSVVRRVLLVVGCSLLLVLCYIVGCVLFVVCDSFVVLFVIRWSLFVVR